MYDTCNLIPTVSVVPTFLPITLEEAKKQIEHPTSDDTHDDHLRKLIEIAVDKVQRDTGMYLCSQTLSVNTHELCDGMQLQGFPISSITSLKYYDSGNVQTTLSTSVYSLNAAHRKIQLNYYQLFPVTTVRWDAWEIKYVVGYSSVYTVPPLAKAACLLLIGRFFLLDRGDLLKEPNTKSYENMIQNLCRGTYP